MEKEYQATYPSNIALVKYWGKRAVQLPCNASLSMTLSKACTKITLHCSEKKHKETEFSYYFEGAPKASFRKRVLEYIEKQKEFSGLLNKYALRMEAKNNFPHSAGIASSASAFAAIAAVLLKASGTAENNHFRQEASRLARLGSGSACRSFYGPYASWGDLKELKNSSDQYAIPVEQIHEDFRSMRDSILIVDDAPKRVSSSVGHALMEGHPYAAARFEDANKHCKELLQSLKNGDFNRFISITEREALSLHAMMMTSEDYYWLIKPGTIQIMEQIFQFRKDSGLPICFTLDAGPNVHLLYPEAVRDSVKPFLAQLMNNGLKTVIEDQAGEGGFVN